MNCFGGDCCGTAFVILCSSMICQNMRDLFSCPEEELKNRLKNTFICTSWSGHEDESCNPLAFRRRNKKSAYLCHWFSFFFPFFLMFLKISLCLASICGMKSVITVLKAAVWDLGFAAAFPAMWEALPGADCQSGASVGWARIPSPSRGGMLLARQSPPWALRLVFIHQIRVFLELVLIWQASQLLLWNEPHNLVYL